MNYNSFTPNYKTVTPPPFWLKVRKDYILENFRELLEYMQKYPYQEGVPNPDYDVTLDSMYELSCDFADLLSSQPFQNIPEFSYPVTQVVALMGATVLARAKKGQSPSTTLRSLAALLLSAYPDLPQDTQAGLWRVLTLCCAGREIRRVTFTWRTVSGDLNPRILAERVAETEFLPAKRSEERFYLENGGLMILSPTGVITFSGLNLNEYKIRKPRTQFICGSGFKLGGMAEIRVKQGDFERLADFTSAYKSATAFMRSLSDFKPSAIRRVKEYAVGDILPVEIVAKMGIKMVVRSIDPDYKMLQGNVFMKLDPDHRPSTDTVRDFFKPGDIIEVTYFPNEKCLFEMSSNLETHYREMGCDVATQTLKAFYDSKYPGGSQWITEEGLRIGIADEKVKALTDDELDIYEEAIEKGQPIWVRAYKEAPKKDGVNFYVYAEPVFDDPEIPEKFGRHEADENFADTFLSYCYDAYSHLRNNKDPWRPLPPGMASILARTMAVLADGVSRTTRERLDNLLCAAVACHIAGRKDDYEFLHHEILFLSRLVDFAQGREIRPLIADDEMKDLGAVSRRSKILDKLREYVNPVLEENVNDKPLASIDSDGEDFTIRVSKLIEASNNLVGIIRPRELDNIKRTIATTLGVDDEYKTILSDRKWYGDENEQLEFKLSVVFPPLNRRRNNLVADPEGQKWAIIKAICAFLNSVDGGTLLIGVNDFGFAEGVESDIQELFRMKYISSADMDHYKQHIMRFIDNVFREQSGNKSGNDIVTGRIKYIPEESPEGRQLLRINVEPYPYDVVEIREEVPEGMAQAYVRGSGRSQPLTAALATELRASRLRAGEPQL